MQTQWTLKNTRYTIDFYLPSLNLLAEVNGPAHYLHLLKDKQIVETNVFEGRTKVKDRVAKALGYKIIHLHYSLFEKG